MDVLVYLLIAVVIYLATTITSLVGFADKLALIAVLSLFLDIKTSIFLSAVYSIFLYAFRILFSHQHLNIKLLLKSQIFLIPGLIVGLLVFDYMNSSALKIIFSSFLVLFVFYQIFLKDKLDFKINEFFLGLGIFLFGFLESTIGAAGPLLAVFLIQYGKRKERLVVFAAAILIISSIVRIIGYLYLENFQPGSFSLLYMMIPTAIFSSYTGKILLSKLHAKYFEWLVLAFILALGIGGLATSLLS